MCTRCSGLRGVMRTLYRGTRPAKGWAPPHIKDWFICSPRMIEDVKLTRAIDTCLYVSMRSEAAKRVQGSISAVLWDKVSEGGKAENGAISDEFNLPLIVIDRPMTVGTLSASPVKWLTLIRCQSSCSWCCVYDSFTNAALLASRRQGRCFSVRVCCYSLLSIRTWLIIFFRC